MPEATKVFPDGYFNCSISSPPYWALRDYGVDGQLGLEPTFEEYIEKLCTIYDEVKRVLRDDGTCWVNLGDTYAGSGRGWDGKQAYLKPSFRRDKETAPRSDFQVPGVSAKSLCLIPQRFAIEMVNRGWILRNVIIWHKPNPMPSSAKDRFTVDFEYVFYFVKSNKASYYINPRKMRSSWTQKYDYIWIHRNTGLEVDYQPFSDRLCKGKKRLWNRRNLWEGRDYWFEPQYEPQSETSHPRYARGLTEPPPADPNSKELNRPGYENWRETTPIHKLPLGRNKRTVWTIPTQPFPEAHFATFPEKLVEPMIKAGCPEFVCTKCGKAREKIYDTVFIKKSDSTSRALDLEKQGDRSVGLVSRQGTGNNEHYFKGYTDCGCNAEWRPGIVLDCFCRQLYYRQGRCQAA